MLPILAERELTERAKDKESKRERENVFWKGAFYAWKERKKVFHIVLARYTYTYHCTVTFYESAAAASCV